MMFLLKTSWSTMKAILVSGGLWQSFHLNFRSATVNCSSLPRLLTKKSASSVVTLRNKPGMPSHGDPLATCLPFFIAVQLIHNSSSPFLSLMCKFPCTSTRYKLPL
uniref:Uncharacterized protein n=1 Tax=Zea mays TaxID=4577 RepID=C4J6N1_MAIZE|nr:unknown [Zea mays]